MVPPLAAHAAPVIVGDQDHPACVATLNIADTAFRSARPSLTWPVTITGTDVRFILGRKAADISDGDGLLADLAIFERIEGDGQNRAIYWQRQPVNGRRLVAVDRRFNMRGDWYYLYALDAAVAQPDFLRQISMEEGLTTAFTPILGDNRWYPPLVLASDAVAAPWVVDQGEPYHIMADWLVITVTGQDSGPLCRVDFTPDGQPGLDALPPEVRRFARLADEALGPGNDEGSLQPTARLRLAVAKGWALVSHRPWALTSPPYNSRTETVAGLARWAGKTAGRTRLYRALRQSERPAHKALSAYYQARFALTPAQANPFAAHALDHMLRTHFTFSRTNSEKAGPENTLPAVKWPADIR